MKNSKQLRELIFMVFVASLSACGGGGGGSAGVPAPAEISCPGYEGYAAYASQLQQEAREAVHFGSVWEATIKVEYIQPWQFMVIPREALTLMLPDNKLTQEKKYNSETKATIKVPPQPASLTCSEITAIVTATPGEAEAKQEIRTMIFFNVEEVINDISFEASGYHSSSVSEGYEQFYKVFGVCQHPCSNSKTVFSGCDAVQESHISVGSASIYWFPGEDATLGLSLVSDATPDNRVQVESYPDVGTGAGSGSTFCELQNPVCLGRINEEQACGLGYIPPYLTNSVPLKKGFYVLYDKENTEFTHSWRRDTLELDCVSGCECNSDSQCDDGKVCTSDKCVSGNCKNTPDDTIDPGQVTGDCRTCENGEVKSVREQAENECAKLRMDNIKNCDNGAASSDDWLMHWTQEFAGAPLDFHYCAEGFVLGDSVSSICNGAGVCASGSKVSTSQGSFHHECRSLDAQELVFACDVLCAVCQ